MGLFQKLFGSKTNDKVMLSQQFQLLNGYTPAYTSFNGGLYELAQVRAIVHTIATDCGKAIPELAKRNKKYQFMLTNRPNPFMNISDFIERVVTLYLLDNNAFIVPMYDEYGQVRGLFPISYNDVTAVEHNGAMYLKYSFGNGTAKAIEYANVGHLKRMQYKNDLYGENNYSVLSEDMQIVHAQNEAIKESLKQSGVVRFKAKLNGMLLDKRDFEEERELFADLNLSSKNKQLMIFDDRFASVDEVTSKPSFLNKDEVETIEENFLKYFGVSSKVIKHEFSNDYEWNSYFEGVIEPILIKLSLELTKMLYTPEQIMNGAYVYVTTNRLQYMSNESKLAYSSQMFDRGILTINDVCDVWNLSHKEDGDKRYIRKEYAEISHLSDENVELEELHEEDENTQEGGENDA